jgi:MarC family membrane protein
MYTMLSAAILLLLIMDPLGNIPVFASTLKAVQSTKRKIEIICREHLIAFVVLGLFIFVGESVLSVLGLSGGSLQIAGGVVLFLIALRMIFPAPPSLIEETSSEQEPLIVPLAIPLISGPSALAAVLLLVSQSPDMKYEWLGSIGIAVGASCAILVAGISAQKMIGERVLTATERLMGLILVAISVEMVVKGIKGLF